MYLPWELWDIKDVGIYGFSCASGKQSPAVPIARSPRSLQRQNAKEFPSITFVGLSV